MIRTLKDLAALALTLIALFAFLVFVFNHAPNCADIGAPTGELSCKGQ